MCIWVRGICMCMFVCVFVGLVLPGLMREILIAPSTVAHGNQCLICRLLDKGFNAEAEPRSHPLPPLSQHRNYLVESICSFCLRSVLCLQSAGIWLSSCVFVNVPALNKMVVITWEPLSPPDTTFVCFWVCMRCPECCITPLTLPVLGVCIDQPLEWRNACPAHKINGCCFLSSNGLLLSAMNTKHIL